MHGRYSIQVSLAGDWTVRTAPKIRGGGPKATGPIRIPAILLELSGVLLPMQRYQPARRIKGHNSARYHVFPSNATFLPS